MVKLTKIYTRGGDAGEASLGDGSRVPKTSLRLAAYGTVDEANAAIGMARLHTEGDADRMLMSSFVLPGGTPAAAHLHLARTVMRRAEREMVALAGREPINEQALKYANRLSDHLFVLGRFLNDKGARDVLWVPGATRS